MTGRIINVKAKVKASDRGLKVDADGTYVVRTPAAPEKGRANEDIREILAEHLGIAKSRIELVGGQTSRKKRFLIGD